MSDTNSKSKQMRIAITTGEPAGVGPELMYHLSRYHAATLPLHARCASVEEGGLSSDEIAKSQVELVLIGNKALLEERMKLFGSDFILHDFKEDEFVPSGPDESGLGHLSCLNIELGTPSIAGRQDERNSPYVLATLDRAIELCLSGLCDAMVTAPISKSIIAKTGIEFTGHTEYLQEKCHCNEVVMMLGCSKMNVALVTTHLPLNKVSEAITKEKLTNIISILHHDLKAHMGFASPQIYVCGLNPHAGEDGTLGMEEIETISPVIESLNATGNYNLIGPLPADTIYVCGLNPHAGEDGTLGMEEIETISPVIESLNATGNYNLIGPLPADTLFQKKYLDKAAAILSMYHDQGLPVLKYAGFDEGYNTTLGLPFIRTSVDHGTACDLAGKAIADEGSLLSAVSLAIYMANHRHNSQ